MLPVVADDRLQGHVPGRPAPSVIMEQAIKESATNPLNAPTGFDAPVVTDTPAAEEAPAEDAAVEE